MTQLDRIPDPPCPHCGCPESRIVASGTRWGAPMRRRRCALCEGTWTIVDKPAPARAPEPPEDGGGEAVAYVVTRCPHCGGGRTRITRTDQPIRYHVCQDCGARFRSVEAA